MKKKLNIVIIIISIFFLIEIILNRNLIFDTIGFSLNIWITSIIPSLFPFFVISDILNSYNVINYIPKFIKNIFKKLFNISDNSLFIFFISMLSGFPSNARNIKILYKENKITKEEAEHLLFFTHFSNPMFILGTLVVIFLNNKSLGIPILISHYLPNFIIAILLRKYNNPVNNYIINKKNNPKFGITFTKSIKSSIDSLLLILGTLSVFLIISTVIINLFNLNTINSLLIKSILELTSGLKELSMINFNSKLLIILSSCILSFGGLSVHMQVINELTDTDISYRNFFIGRIFQTTLSLIISYLITLFTF